MRFVCFFSSVLMAATAVLCSPRGALASEALDQIGGQPLQAADSPRTVLATSVEEVSLPITPSPSGDELGLEEAMALCLDGDIPSCMGARLAVLAACGGTVLLVATPIPGDEVVVYAACHSAFVYWTQQCVRR